MRRAIAVAVVSGLVSGGAVAAPAWAQQHAHAHSQAPPAMKTIVYAGYELRVPASWPVYRLDENPSTCVRYDVHAVYLGTPGANEKCPAWIIGRTQTVSVIPSTQVAAGSGPEISYQRAQPFQAGAAPVASLPAVDGAVMQNAEQHELRVTLGAPAQGTGATIVATYAGSSAAVEQVLASLAPAGQRAQALQAARVRQAGQATTPPPAQPTTQGWHGVPSAWPTQIVTPPPPPQQPQPSLPPQPSQPSPPQPARPVPGFDTCTAPSLKAMRAWRRAYRAVGVYIGGVNAACAYGNLTAKWVRSAAGMGWGLIPTYVGPQAPCSGIGVTINSRHAASEGQAAGIDAVNDARLFGMPAGSPIYDDMEAYDNQTRGCTAAVLTFLGAWDRAVTTRGYVSAVYSSQDSGIDDMQAAAVAKTPGFTVPDAIWFAHWDNQATLSDGTLVWPLQDRDKQYQAPHNRTVGRITLNIDGDLVGGPLARLPHISADRTVSRVEEPPDSSGRPGCPPRGPAPGATSALGLLACAARSKISAAAWWNPGGSPAASIDAAISSISATQRQPLAAAADADPSERAASPGWDMAHSASSVCSTPSARASARHASSSAPLPLVHAAYAIFTADAA